MSHIGREWGLGRGKVLECDIVLCGFLKFPIDALTNDKKISLINIFA